jgi:hypothetical protein
MAEQNGVGQHLAELYNDIHEHNKLVADAEENVKNVKAALEKVKAAFASYLQQQGIDKLLAPAQVEAVLSDNQKSEAKERKPRTSSEDKQAQIERNKATYVSTYPNGVDEKTGLPKRFKGRGPGNQEIDALMKDDERDYEANQNKQSEVTTISKGAGDEQAADNLIKATAPKSASKSKAKAETQPA